MGNMLPKFKLLQRTPQKGVPIDLMVQQEKSHFQSAFDLYSDATDKARTQIMFYIRIESK
jgi:hypothetical protein